MARLGHPPRAARLLRALLPCWAASALPLCYQLPYQKHCCVSPELLSGEALALETSRPECQVYGHSLMSSTGYLAPPGGAGFDPDGIFQDAFLKQGVYNTNHYVDCRSTWMGVNVRQPAQDLLAIQQLVFNLRPRLIVETGTGSGGFAFYLASLFHLMSGMGDARIVTIDARQKEANGLARCPGQKKPGIGSLARNNLWRHYVREVVSDSVSKVAKAVVRDELDMQPKGAPVMVSLDADHIKAIVWKEMMAYAPLVTVGSYLIVQDVILSFAKYPWDGPLGAVEMLLSANATVQRTLGTFVRDDSVPQFGYTGHMYLRRVA